VEAGEAKAVQEITLPIVGGEDSILHALWEQLMDIQEGHMLQIACMSGSIRSHMDTDILHSLALTVA